MQGELRKTLETLAVLGILATGFYPLVSNAWNQRAADRMMVEYRKSLWTDGTEDMMRAVKAEAEGYNQRLMLSGGGMNEKEAGSDYESMLNPDGSGVMGYLEIPKISVSLPILHGTGDEVLARGIGHLQGSSLPVGGKGTHAVLTGHRGLPSARLFTDLDQMEETDRFRILTLGEELDYEVSEIRTVLPENTRDLKIFPEEDLVTLVTCTPYGVNTHRLLVTGKRIREDGETESTQEIMENRERKNVEEVKHQAARRVRLPGFLWKKPAVVFAAAGVVICAFMLRILWIWTVYRGRRRNVERLRSKRRIRSVSGGKQS